jgi:dihydroflavonol-4-reductase
MAVLVTGATGFVGGWLVRALLEKGEDVHVLHRRQSNLDEIKGLKFTSKIGDITDRASLNEACKGMDTVFHLAGLVGYSRALRPAMEQVNVEGTRTSSKRLKNRNRNFFI